MYKWSLILLSLFPKILKADYIALANIWGEIYFFGQVHFQKSVPNRVKSTSYLQQIWSFHCDWISGNYWIFSCISIYFCPHCISSASLLLGLDMISPGNLATQGCFRPFHMLIIKGQTKFNSKQPEPNSATWPSRETLLGNDKRPHPLFRNVQIKNK